MFFAGRIEKISKKQKISQENNVLLRKVKEIASMERLCSNISNKASLFFISNRDRKMI